MTTDRRLHGMGLGRRAHARWLGSNHYAGSGPPPYLGQVATRCFMSNEKAGGGLTQSMNRTRHIARDAITSCQVVFANWYGSGEVATGASATIKASVEYPAGTFTQVLFSGSASGTIPSGSQLVSDAVSVSIPDGATFYVRSHFTCASGFPYNGRTGDTANGDRIAFATSGLADKTMSDPLAANAAANFFYSPVAIIAMTTKPAIMCMGDSKCFGYSDIATGTSGDAGELARSIGPLRAYINAGCSGETTTAYLAQHTQRAKLYQYCSHFVSQYGVNDIFGGFAAATTYANLATIRALVSTKPFYQGTISPQSTSTDAWATTVNQTTKAQNPARVTLNGLIRANSNGFNGWFEIADVVETARDSGIWLAPGYTPDGVHETNTANLAIQASGNIDPTIFVR